MIHSARLAFPALLFAVPAALFLGLSVMPRAARAQTVPTLGIENARASEDAAAVEFVVSFGDGETSTSTVTVDYATADGTAEAASDYTETSGTLTFDPGVTSRVIAVPVTDDSVAEVDETFTLTLSNPSNAALPGGDPITVAGVIVDDEKPKVTVTVRSDEVFEGQPAVFDLVRTGAATDRLLLPFRVSIADIDNVVIPGALYDNWAPSFITPGVVIPAGERKVTWNWSPEDGIGEDYLIHMVPHSASGLFDVEVEVDSGDPDFPRRFLTLTVHQRPGHRSPEASSADDGLPGVTIAAGSGGGVGVPTLTEAEDATFTLTRTGDTSEALAVRVYTEEPRHPGWDPTDAANPSGDFHDVTFSAGSATATLTVAIDDDGVAEDADWLDARISPPAGSAYRSGDPHRAWVNVIDRSVDHDGLGDLLEVGLVAVTSSVDEGQPIRVDTRRSPLPDDGRDYPPLAIKVHISQDGAGIPVDRLGITASVHPWYADHGTNRLGFPTLADDGREPDTTVTFTILESPEYRIDPERAGVTVTVRDVSEAPVLEIADATAHRGAGAIDFRVSYADGLPSFQTVTVAYSTSDGTATAEQEYTGAGGTLTIPPGETGGVISVPLLTGANQEANLDFTLALSDPSEATFADGEPQVSATGTINYRARIRMRAGQSEVLEGEAAVFELTRDGSPTAELTFQVFTEEPTHPQATASDNPSRGSHDVTFPAGSPTATLSVTAHRDRVEESGRDYLEARVVGPAGNSEYRLGAPSKATVEILDSVPDVTVAADRETIDESAIVGDIEVFPFTLTRTGDLSEALAVVVRVDDPEMIRCWDHVFWFGFGSGDNCPNGPTFEQEVTFAEDSSTATLSVEIFDDWRDVPDGAALSVTVLDGAGYRPGDPASDSVTLVDDDETSVLILNVSHDEVTEGQTLTCTVNRYGSISDYGEQFSLAVSGTGRGQDVRASAFVTLAPGDERYTATIELPDDDHFGGNWTQTCRIDWVDLYVPLAQERQYFVVLSRRSITVPVRDAGGPRVTIAADQDVITEGEAATFTLTRPGDASEPLSVNVSVEDPGHFMRGNHTWTAARPASKVEFEAGSATATLTLPTRDDWRDIPDGTLTATIEPGDRRDYRPGDTSSASVTVEDNDTKPVFELSVGKETYTEGDRVVFTLTRTGDMTHPQTVRLLVGRQAEQRERTYEFRGGALTQQMVIPTQDNDLDEADVVFVAEFPDRSGDEYYAVGPPYSVIATVEDDDLPRVGIEALADSYREGDRTAFRLTREGQTDSTLPVTLRLTESGQNAVINTAFQLGTRTPVMRASYATYDHHLLLDEGDGDEYDGAIDVVLVERDGYVIDPGRSAASFTVLDTDPTPTLEVSGSRTVSESDGTVEFEVSYSGPASQKEVTVDYATDDGTAAAGDDYTAVAGTLTFGEGETSGVIPVPVSQDSRPEYDESFNLALSNPRNALLADGAPTVTTVVTIEDDEPRVSIAAVAAEVTEGEPAVFTLTRTGGDTTKKLSVSLLLMEETEESSTNRLVPLIETFPENTTTIQVSHETEDDDVDAPALKVLGVVRDLAALYRPSTYLPFRDVALVIVLDDEVPTVTIEAAAPTIEFGTNATFTLTREGDLSDALTVSPDITQEGESDGGNPLPPSASFATGPSTVTFEAGSSTATLRLTTTSSSTYTSDGGDSHTVEVDWGRVNAALPDSDAYITGDPARAAVLVVAHARNYPIVYIDTPSPVTEGEDLVFTLHRTKGEDTELTARVRMNTQAFAWPCPGPNCWTFHDVTFEPGSLTATLTVPTEDNEINDGNTLRTVSLALDGRAGVDVPYQGELGYIWKNTRNHPPNARGWVRDDDIPTVWVTPETGERFEDTEDRSRFTIHRDSYTTTETHAFIGYQELRRWPPPLADTLYSRLYKTTNFTLLLDSGESSHEYGFGPNFVGPLGGESRFFLLPHYCGDHDIEDCGTYPQYHLGSPSSGVIKVYNRFAGILIETGEADVEEGEDVTFTLTRFGGTPGSNGHPLTVWVEVTQEGEYLEGMPPQTVKFRGWPDTTIEGADRTITLTIPTTDDQVNEPHGAITLRILPPERIDVDEPSSYEAGLDDELAPFETATVRVTDNDPPTMSISDARAGEADGSMEFTVSVGNPSAREISVEWSTVAETGVDVAIADTDYTAAGGKLTFAAGETSRTISVDVLDDNLAENEETFKVVLAAQTMVNAIAGDNEGVGTIEDDDEGRVVTIYPQDPAGEVEEGDTAIFVIQSLGGSGELNVTLKIDLVGDFTDHSSSSFPTGVVIPAGETEFLLRAITIDDDEVEANGSVTATVQPGDGYLPGIPDTATLNIRDNDRTLSIADVEAGEGAGEMTFTLRLSAAAEEEVRVEAFTLADGKASPTGDITGTSLGQDYEPKTEWVVFEPGETEQSFTVTVVDDYIDEPPSETFSVRLVHPSSNVWLTGAAATATGTIKDNDDPMEARISRDAKRVDEDRSGAVRFAVELTHEDTIASERDTKLFWTVTTGTATEGADYEKPYGQNRGTLEIPVGHLTGTIEVDLVDDYLLEDRFETFTVALVEARNLELPDREGDKSVEIKHQGRRAAAGLRCLPCGLGDRGQQRGLRRPAVRREDHVGNRAGIHDVRHRDRRRRLHRSQRDADHTGGPRHRHAHHRHADRPGG